jgi:hypothetical protein
MAALILRPASRTMREPLFGRGYIVRSFAGPQGVRYRYAYPLWQAVLLSLAVGFASSLFGIGGGVIHVPSMIVLFRIPVELAVATSHFVLAMMAGGGSIVHLASGSFSGEALARTGALAVGAVPGAQAGAWIAHRIHGRSVLRLLVLALVVLAGRLVFRGILDV